MASIKKIGDSWRALIRRKGHKPICITKPTKDQAEREARRIEAEIDAGKRPTITSSKITVAQLIGKYRQLCAVAKPISDSSNQHYMLNHLEEDLGKLGVATLTEEDLIGWATMRKDQGAGPYTINMELSQLGTVIKYGGAGLGLPDVVGTARPLLHHLRLIGGGGKRQRRPTRDELERLLAASPQWMVEVIEFAIATAMRRGEICKIRWGDVDEQRRVVRVRDRKDPRRKQGNDQDVPLLSRAWDVLQQRRLAGVAVGERIFPYHETTVTKTFTQLCRELSIPDLHFHDLRHEGTSQLFEMGYEIQEVALVTGHKSWANLRIYTNLKPDDLHERDTGRGSRPRRGNLRIVPSRQRKSG
jgi:integrase